MAASTTLVDYYVLKSEKSLSTATRWGILRIATILTPHYLFRNVPRIRITYHQPETNWMEKEKWTHMGIPGTKGTTGTQGHVYTEPNGHSEWTCTTLRGEHEWPVWSQWIHKQKERTIDNQTTKQDLSDDWSDHQLKSSYTVTRAHATMRLLSRPTDLH